MSVNGEPLEPIGAGAAHFDLVDGDEPVKLPELRWVRSQEARIAELELGVRAALIVLEDNFDASVTRNKLATRILGLLVPVP